MSKQPNSLPLLKKLSSKANVELIKNAMLESQDYSTILRHITQKQPAFVGVFLELPTTATRDTQAFAKQDMQSKFSILCQFEEAEAAHQRNLNLSNSVEDRSDVQLQSLPEFTYLSDKKKFSSPESTPTCSPVCSTDNSRDASPKKFSKLFPFFPFQ